MLGDRNPLTSVVRFLACLRYFRTHQQNGARDMANKVDAEKLPHSWAVDDWPVSVYPCRASRGRYIVRTHRAELVSAGALTRVGRGLVVLGAGYSAWLAKQRTRVEGFEIAPNFDRSKSR
jgi:hypothetical protein